MAKTLLIVESPGKIKTLNKILGKDFLIKASVGHIRDLPRNDINIDISSKGFVPHYKVSPDKKKVVNDLKNALKSSDKILLAPDPDREGEAIAWHLAHILKVDLKDKCRVVFNAITPTEVKNGIKNAGYIDINRVNAQQSRRMLDRIVGYKLSPFLWRKVQKGLSAGRVQSVAVLLVVEREKEIEAFKPEEYFVFKGDFQCEEVLLKNTKLVKINKKKADKLTIKKEKAEQIKNEIEENKENFKITQMKNKKKKVSSPQPFITSTLQQEASRVNGFSASQTMSVAQKLYEGKSIGGTNYGLITYMRTDSVRVSPEGNDMAKKYITSLFGEEYYEPSSKRVKSKGKGKVQDAHEAIRPTYINDKFAPHNIKNYLTGEEYRLYKLIWNRFLASQMKSAIFDVEDINISDDKYTFNIKFEKINFQGYQKIYKSEDDNVDEAEFVTIKEGEKSIPKEVQFESKFTKPPARFTEASLIKTLEKEGIGRPSTYASIMKKIMDRNYVVKIDKILHPTDLGIVVNYMMTKFFERIVNVKFTAQFETKLDKVEEGDLDYQKVLLDFYEGFEKNLEKNMKIDKVEIKTDIRCEKCGKTMNLKFSKGELFLACSGFPDCRCTLSVPAGERLIPAAFSEDKLVEISERMKNFEQPARSGDENAELAGEKCDKCGSEMIIKSGRYGRFMACPNYPSCKNTKPILEKLDDIKCPEEGCEGDIVIRKSKRGKAYYTCSKYPECKFFSFEQPLKDKCSECGQMLYKKENKAGDIICKNKECPSNKKVKETSKQEPEKKK